MRFTRGNKSNYIGMDLYFSDEVKVRVIMVN